MKKLAMLTLAATAATALGGCTTYGATGAGDWGYYDRGYYSRYGAYDYNRPDPRYNGYYADRYYRQDSRYRERVLSRNDRVYRGQDGRYYCKRSDGTTGLIVGAAAGGLFGNVIAGGRSKTVGTLLGAIAGGALGSSVDRNQVRCR